MNACSTIFDKEIDCPRCQTKHTARFRPLANPTSEINYFGVCEETQHPIFMAISLIHPLLNPTTKSPRLRE